MPEIAALRRIADSTRLHGAAAGVIDQALTLILGKFRRDVAWVDRRERLRRHWQSPTRYR